MTAAAGQADAERAETRPGWQTRTDEKGTAGREREYTYNYGSTAQTPQLSNCEV
jgi:hypothetical protein